MVPTFDVFVAGETNTWDKVGLPTVTADFPVIPLTVAMIVAAPALSAVASPGFACPALSTETTPEDEEVHVAVVVRFCVVPLLKFPIAVNCCVAPWASDGFAGVKIMEVSFETVVVTVSVALPEMPFTDAVIVVEPEATAVASPGTV